MCGIAGIISKSPNRTPLVPKLKLLSRLLAHRGPDGEGFLLANRNSVTPYFDSFAYPTTGSLPFLPAKKLPEQDNQAQLGLLHRRLSIIELSEKGHQPMCEPSQSLWITYNGEIYNYPELKQELKGLGHEFYTESDTEVILAAYRQWNEQCVHKFNGMWSFVIYDSVRQRCFASRDRLGVKPFYYTGNPDLFAFASEQKALVGAGLCRFAVNEKALHHYLVNVQLESEEHNLFEGIYELMPGHNLFYNLNTHELSTKPYYHLLDRMNQFNNTLSDEELIGRIAGAVKQSVSIRLRSDVEVGTCLSGGIDSSAIAVCIAELQAQPFHCFTSVFRNTDINEEHFADVVVQKTRALSHKVEPSFEGFCKEVDELIYSQDVPIWDTSTYAQYKVMQLVKQTGLKVVLDGQGADELFAGYHHHFLALWNHDFSTGHFARALRHIRQASESIPHPLLFFFKEQIKQRVNLKSRTLGTVLSPNFIKAYPVVNSSRYQNKLNLQLLDDIYRTRLKSFLKCEDRCGMWHSVESRVPFSDDVELIELMFSFDGQRKIQNGTSKYLLREALKNKLPAEIYARRDKKGFDTPSQNWLSRLRPQMMREITEAKLPFVQEKLLPALQTTEEHNRILFRLFVYCRWKQRFAAEANAPQS